MGFFRFDKIVIYNKIIDHFYQYNIRYHLLDAIMIYFVLQTLCRASFQDMPLALIEMFHTKEEKKKKKLLEIAAPHCTTSNFFFF